MKKLFLPFCLMITLTAFSQKNQVIYLWPGKVPGETSEKKEPVAAPSRNDNVYRISEVTNPSLEVFQASSVSSNGAVIVCPGGGYSILAYDKEGTEIATWLNKLGYTAFVLQYRVPQKKEGALQDIQRAIRLVRNDSKKWNIDPEKIGVIGFSAGGSLCARAGTMFSQRTYAAVDKADSLSCRPSFAMLIYPAYLDQGPDLSLTPELKMSPEIPPMFLFQTADDTFANSSLVMAGALRKQKIPVEIHLLPKGGHGYGLRPGIDAAETWPALAGKWLSGLAMK
ncbi:MAG: alpha/beta hydrolase [Methanosarcina sp.]